MRPLRTCFQLLGAAALMLPLQTGALAKNNAAPPATGKPQLVILISVDQFSADLFNSNRSRFHGGLARLSSGIVYSNAFHAHGTTETCTGHAVIATGRNPNEMGIVSNNWFDLSRGKEIYCTDDATNSAARAERRAGVGPGLLESQTIGDWLKAVSADARVYSVSGKDRSAIMMGGHNPNGAYWLDGDAGFDSWGPTKAQAQARLQILTDFNSKLTKSINRKSVRWDYADPQCRNREQSYTLPDGSSFRSHVPPDAPVDVTGIPASEKRDLPGWFYDQAALDAAADIIATQKLGQNANPDFLAIGLSGTDIIGHAYGTSGPEMCDQMFRLDRTIGKFLDGLAAKKLNVAVVLTADHGGSDMAERLEQASYADARHLDMKAFVDGINRSVMASLRLDWPPIKPLGYDISQLMVVGKDGKRIADEATATRIADAAVAAAKLDPAALDAWTRNELANHKVDNNQAPNLMSLEDRMALSYYPGRGSDIVIAFRPLLATGPSLPGRYVMGHSGPYDFNRRVPILIWQSGMAHSERNLPVRVTQVAPTVAKLLGIADNKQLDAALIR